MNQFDQYNSGLVIVLSGQKLKSFFLVLVASHIPLDPTLREWKSFRKIVPMKKKVLVTIVYNVD